jgi:D-alanine-D-alanine ligase
MRDFRQRIAVLMGGCSAEREISLVTAQECISALRTAGYSDVVEIDTASELARSLADLKPDVCFNALHGPIGEDGSIQGFLNVLGR